MPGRITIKEEPLDPDRPPRTWFMVLLVCDTCHEINASIEMDHVPTLDELKAYRCYKCQGPIVNELL